MIISRTPFRISFFGGGTDYPDWYREHGGAVLSTTIDKYCYISVRELPPFFDHKFRVVYSIVENVQDVSRDSAIRRCAACCERLNVDRASRSITTAICRRDPDSDRARRSPSG